MTKAEIILEARNLLNELSADAGALFSDTGNLASLLEDSTEHVVLDLASFYPSELLDYEDVNIVAATATYTLTKTFWQVLKFEKRVSGEEPGELEVVDPLSRQYTMRVGDTSARPWGVWLKGTALELFPTPTESITGYVRVWGIVPEATTMAAGGPTKLPRETHRLIVYRMAELGAIILGADATPFAALYAQRLGRVRSMQKDKFQSSPRFVRESVVERTTRDTRDPALYDVDWP
jgi:hypothetical protein